MPDFIISTCTLGAMTFLMSMLCLYLADSITSAANVGILYSPGLAVAGDWLILVGNLLAIGAIFLILAAMARFVYVAARG